jgi:glycosyltransferase involved in cell wall biosynthesis
MSLPLISVVMPAYNAQNYIASSLDSILNQPCKDFEIIVVNDGSKDKTAEILNQYSAKHKEIKVLNQKNQGVSVARNTGIEAATGKYIAFLDSDDFWASNFYDEKLHELLLTEDHDMLAFDFFVANSKCKRGNIIGSKDRLNENTKFLFLWNHFASCIYLREMINKNNIRFPVGQKIDEDNATLFLCICASKDVYPISRCGLVYRNNWNSVTYKIDNKCNEKLSVIGLWQGYKKIVSENDNFYSEEAITMCDIKIAISVLDYINFAAKEGKTFEEINSNLVDVSGDEIIKSSVSLKLPQPFEVTRNQYLENPQAYISSQKRSFTKKLLNKLDFLKRIYVDYRSYDLVVEDYLKTNQNNRI